MFKIKFSKPAFTLIELLVYMGLLVVALGLASSLLFQVSRSDPESNARVEIEEEARLIVNHFKLEVEKSQDSTEPSTDGQSAAVLTLTQAGDKTVTFKVVDGSLVKEEAVSGVVNLSEKLTSDTIKIEGFSAVKIGDPAQVGDSAIGTSFRILPRTDSLASLSQNIQTSFILNL